MRVNFPNGVSQDFPDGTSQQEIDNFYASSTGGTQQQPPSWGNAVSMALKHLSTGQQQQEESTLPRLAGANLAFAAPGTATRLMQAEQNSRQDSLRAKLERERMAAQQLESEKMRANQIKLEVMRHKNNTAEAQLRLDKDLNLIDREEENGKIVIGSDGVARRAFMKKDPQTGEKKFTVETYGKATPEPTKLVTGYDENGNAVRMVDAPGANLGKRPAQDASDPARLNAIANWAKYYSGYGRKQADGTIVPISSAEASALAEAKYYERPVPSEIADTPLYPLTEKSDKQRDAFTDLKEIFGQNWQKADKQTAASALVQRGYSKDQIEAALGPMNKPDLPYKFWDGGQNYSIPNTGGSVANGGKEVSTPKPASTPTTFDDEAAIPEGATVQDEQGRLHIKKNGILKLVTSVK
jgi:hypothetical protein